MSHLIFCRGGFSRESRECSPALSHRCGGNAAHGALLRGYAMKPPLLRIFEFRVE